ncbi:MULTISPECIES: hypothetical protein [Deinococcus]|uniref:DUF4064 domain-containing protein n=2 Tax=Deinococcus TaxID=1298 RepID=A0A221SY82_9DEIO|nr:MULTISPECIES: hypothetical protein [Deinococcus]ASN81602.1 hypothetical protein DFI_11890 [Deinococcus ficus]MDP9765004.1 hypothetical protein [Deinococcus enclensis]GHF90968.1 hypothetical protein GCM10017782_30020 [Deinococcus ficus]
MTQSTPTQSPSPSPAGPKPRRLSWVTTPLLAGIVFNSIELLLLPSQGRDTILASNKIASEMLGQTLPAPTDAELQGMVWMLFFVTAAIITWLYLTRQAALEGRRWAVGSTVVIGVLSLLIVPFGTVLGAVMLVGVFDRDVRAYLSR